MFEGSTCSCSHPAWKPISHIVAAKVSRITSWVFVHLLPWAQRKRWIPIRSTRCVHMHQGTHVIEGWGNPSCIQNVVEKTKEVNRRLAKIG